MEFTFMRIRKRHELFDSITRDNLKIRYITKYWRILNTFTFDNDFYDYRVINKMTIINEI